MQRYTNNVQNQSGQAVQNASVTVLNYPSLTTATIYADNSGTPMGNPITTDKLGFFAFYAADGRYSVSIAGPGIKPYQLDDILEEEQLALVAGNGTDAGTLTGAEIVPVNRGAGLLQTTLTKVATFAFQSFAPNVKGYGAKGDGSTDDSAALAMADAAGSTYFTAGVYYIAANIAFVNKTYFAAGASIKIATGVTVTFNERIDAPRQNLFTFVGTAAVLLSGEGSHAVYPEWFGVFPNRTAVDSAPLLQTLSNSVIAGRECFIPFSAGTYYLNGPVNWSTGTIIASGCATFVYTSNQNLFNTVASLTDNSGAVSKQIANNI